MQDFLIMTRKASAQFKKILKWDLANEYDLRRVLMGILKSASIVKTKGLQPRIEFTYHAQIVNPKFTKNVEIRILRAEDKLSPDGTMVCAFVTGISELQPRTIYDNQRPNAKR